MTSSVIKDHLHIARLFKWEFSYICATVDKILTDKHIIFNSRPYCPVASEGIWKWGIVGRPKRAESGVGFLRRGQSPQCHVFQECYPSFLVLFGCLHWQLASDRFASCEVDEFYCQLLMDIISFMLAEITTSVCSVRIASLKECWVSALAYSFNPKLSRHATSRTACYWPLIISFQPVPLFEPFSAKWSGCFLAP